MVIKYTQARDRPQTLVSLWALTGYLDVKYVCERSVTLWALSVSVVLK